METNLNNLNDVSDQSGQDERAEGEPAEPPQPIELLDRTARLRADETQIIVESLRALVERIDVACERVTIECVDDARMSFLHSRWKNDPDTTDVLTFPMSQPTAPLDVDIAVCVDEAERRGAEMGHSRAKELLLYALHGVLHCNGHDDVDPNDFDRMHAEEDRLLEAAGIGALFAPLTERKETEQ